MQLGMPTIAECRWRSRLWPYSGGSVVERLRANLRQVEVIDAELSRREVARE